jgi:hypothetical protein
MSIEHYSVYRLSDGVFTGQQIGIPDVAPDAHKKHALSVIHSDCAVKLGRFDHLSQRVDITVDGHPVTDWQPPQPSLEHEWDPAAKRWTLSAAAQERQVTRAQALEQIAALEAAQHRPIREAALGIPGALERVREIDVQVAALRGTV